MNKTPTLPRYRFRGLSVISVLAVVWALAPATTTAATTIVVTMTEDRFDSEGQGCSLREAIWSANNDQAMAECQTGDGADTVQLGPNQLYTLNLNPFPEEENAGETGDLDIYDGVDNGEGEGTSRELQDPLLTIEGHGSIIDGSGMPTCNVFHILGVPVLMNKLTIQGGGGFILGEDNFSLESIPVPQGGGILVEGTDSSLRSRVQSRVSATASGSTQAQAQAQEGGVTLDEVIVRGNVALRGGGIYNDGGFVELIDSVVGDPRLDDDDDWGNIATGGLGPGCCGGGIYTEGGLTLMLDSTDVVGNYSASNGGGIYNFADDVDIVNGSNIAANQAGFEDSAGEGGGIWTTGGTSLLLDESTVSDNFSAGHGGGVYIDDDDAEIRQSTIARNTAGQSCPDCEITGGDGGGIWTTNVCDDGCPRPTVLENSTVSGNRALVAEGNNSGLGGGAYLAGGELALHSVTINDNFADVAGGNVAIGEVNGSESETIFFNTIITNGFIPEAIELPPRQRSSAQLQQLENCATDGSGIFESDGFNLTDETQEDSDCGLGEAGDIFSADPNLQALDLNPPGLTETHALGSGSPAIDAGPTEENGIVLRGRSSARSAFQPGNSCPDDDQRGVERPIDGDNDGEDECDIGAYEFRRGGGGGPAGGPGQPDTPGPPPPFPGPSGDIPCEIFGTAGNDIIIGTPGDDVICSGAGNDSITSDPLGVASPRGPGVRAPLAGGEDLVRSGPGRDVVNGGPRHDLLIGHQGADRLKGGPAIDLIRGGKGKDTIRGAGGRDQLRGGKGRDLVTGGKGNDFCRGGRGRDRLKGC